MKTFTVKILSVLLLACLCLSFASCKTPGKNPGDTDGTQNSGSAAASASGYFTLDINPSLEFIVRDGKVAKVKASNRDAGVLISGEEFIGLTVEEASRKVTGLSQKMGYLNETNNQVKINVISDTLDSKDLIEAAAKEGAVRGSDIADVNTASRTHESRIVKDLQKKDPDLYKDLTPEKVRLIESIMNYDRSMTYEICAPMAIEALLDLREDLMDEYEDMISEELEDKFDALYDERKQETERKIAEVYAEAYAALHPELPTAKEDYLRLFTASERLDLLLDRLEDSLENPIFTQEDVTAITELLKTHLGKEIDVALLKDEAGNVTVESVETYLDKHLDSDSLTEEEEEKLDALEDALEEILDRYDEESCTLTAEQTKDILAALKDAGINTDELGTELTPEGLEEICEPVEESFEELEEAAEEALTEEQKQAIDALEAEKDRIKAAVHEEMKDEIQKEADRLAAEKKAKLGE